MDTLEEPQLFGAPAGKVTSIGIDHSTSEDSYRSVTIWVHTANRSAPMWLKIGAFDGQDLAPFITQGMVLLNRVPNLGSSLARRTLWAIHARAGKAGLEVSLKNAGTPKK